MGFGSRGSSSSSAGSSAPSYGRKKKKKDGKKLGSGLVAQQLDPRERAALLMSHKDGVLPGQQMSGRARRQRGKESDQIATLGLSSKYDGLLLGVLGLNLRRVRRPQRIVDERL